MQYLLYILLIPFLYLNYKIVISDVKRKIIPNKYLGYLLALIPFYYIYLFIIFPDINYLLFLGQIFLTFIISFILYYFGIWAAGDAKYLLILSLFIPNIGIIPLVGNLALVIIFYLFLYFIWFYFGKSIFYKGYIKELFTNIKNDLNDKWKNYKENKGGKTSTIILKGLLIFLILFTSIRLSRLYLINNYLYENNYLLNNNIISNYGVYIILGILIIIFLLIYLIRYLIKKISSYIYVKYDLDSKVIGNILLNILIFLLAIFIIYEYINNPYKIKEYIIKIFTIYISIYIIFKILIYSYKTTFGVSETDYIDINKLKKGDIVDKPYLIKLFGKQVILGAEGVKQNKKGLLYPNPKKYFEKLENPIDEETLNIIKKSFSINNSYHKKENPNFKENDTIKILKTFSFAPYIFIGFIFTYLIQNIIFEYIINIIIKTIKY